MGAGVQVKSVGGDTFDKQYLLPHHRPCPPHRPTIAARPQCVCCRYLSALRTAAAAAGQQLVGFERYLRLRSKGGNHTHINTLPISEWPWLAALLVLMLLLRWRWGSPSYGAVA